MEVGGHYLNSLVLPLLYIYVSHALNFHQNLSSVYFFSGLNRCGKSCRLRWTNYLRPDIKRGKFSKDEEQTILQLHSILGNKY